MSSTEQANGIADPDLVCDVGRDIMGLDEDERRKNFVPACAGPPFCEHDDGKKYCVLHIPHSDKSPSFEKAIDRKLEDLDSENRFDFSGVWFPDNWSRFQGYEFDAYAEFYNAVFSGGVDFSNAVFKKGAGFYRTLFMGNNSLAHSIDFVSAEFLEKTHFNSAEFDNPVLFNDAKFEKGVRFFLTDFRDEVLFNHAVFTDYIVFAFCAFAGRVAFFGDSAFANDPYVSFYLSRIDSPENLTIKRGNLRPSWFTNVDHVRMFNFSDVRWHGTSSGPEGSLKEEVNTLKAKEEQLKERGEVSEFVSDWIPATNEDKYRALGRAYRELSLNAEEGHRYELAAELRYFSAEAQRKQSWRGFAPLKVSWWHWLLSGHSERPLIATGWLAVIWLGFAVLYTQDSLLGVQLGFESAKQSATPLDVPSALVWSIGAMSRVIEGPDRPTGFGTDATEALVFLEGILGPLQFALVALAVRRKVMR